MAAKVIGGCINGGCVAIDVDIFAGNKDFKITNFLNPEWFVNIDDKGKFLESKNLVEIGKKYPDLVETALGKNKFCFTPEKDPVYFVFVVRTPKVPVWAEGLSVLKVT